jgi:hypothetical protein
MTRSLLRTISNRRPQVIVISLLALGLLPGCGSYMPRGTVTNPPEAHRRISKSLVRHMSESLPTIRRLSHSQETNFAILNTAPEQLPRSVTATLRHPAYGANWALAQRLDTGTQTQVWLLPAHRSLCLIEQQKGHSAVGVTCTSVSQALKHGVVTASLVEEGPISFARRLVVGVAPDNVLKVRVNTSGFRPTFVSVTQNTFIVRDSVSAPPESVEFFRVK